MNTEGISVAWKEKGEHSTRQHSRVVLGVLITTIPLKGIGIPSLAVGSKQE